MDNGSPSVTSPVRTLVYDRLRIFKKHLPSRQLEWWLAVAMVMAGLVLAHPVATFELAPYARLREIAPEDTWAAICLWLGLIRLLVLGINGSLPRGSPHMRAILSILCGAVWVQFGMAYFEAGFPTLLFAFIPLAALTEISNVWRAAGAARREDDVVAARKVERDAGI